MAESSSRAASRPARLTPDPAVERAAQLERQGSQLAPSSHANLESECQRQIAAVGRHAVAATSIVAMVRVRSAGKRAERIRPSPNRGNSSDRIAWGPTPRSSGPAGKQLLSHAWPVAADRSPSELDRYGKKPVHVPLGNVTCSKARGSERKLTRQALTHKGETCADHCFQQFY